MYSTVMGVHYFVFPSEQISQFARNRYFRAIFACPTAPVSIIFGMNCQGQT
jgi:hypothetical protein